MLEPEVETPTKKKRSLEPVMMSGQNPAPRVGSSSLRLLEGEEALRVGHQEIPDRVLGYASRQ